MTSSLGGWVWALIFVNGEDFANSLYAEVNLISSWNLDSWVVLDSLGRSGTDGLAAEIISWSEVVISSAVEGVVVTNSTILGS